MPTVVCECVVSECADNKAVVVVVVGVIISGVVYGRNYYFCYTLLLLFYFLKPIAATAKVVTPSFSHFQLERSPFFPTYLPWMLLLWMLWPFVVIVVAVAGAD